MSRVGTMPIAIPKGVTVEVGERNKVKVTGPNGELSRRLHRSISIEVGDEEITVTRPSNGREHRALHGLTRSLLANMVTGVTEGFEKRLEIHGVGYRAEMQGPALMLRLGYSHPVSYDAPEGVELAEEGGTLIIVRGADKQAVGQVAAEIRALRPVEPYKGKGIRYQGEEVRLKPGKAAKVGADLGV
jgi:large subunit ribosomal protein L6